MDEMAGGACEHCDNPLCLGSFVHEWNLTDDALLHAVLDSDPDILSLVDTVNDNDDTADAGNSQLNDSPQPPSPKRTRFHSVTDEELAVAAAGVVPKNTENNNRWALRNFEAWRAHYNDIHPDSICRDDILLT